MGMFRDFKDMADTYRSDELKEIRRTANAMPKTSMLDSVKNANQALSQAQAWQGQNAANPMPGMAGGMNPMAAMPGYATGTAASATVQSLADSGMQVNGAPVIDLQLMVTVPGQAPYAVSHKQPISPVQIPHFQPGATFPVHVDQADPSKIQLG